MQQLKRLWIFNDPHIPYHDKRAFDLMIRAMEDFKPDIVISNGDFLDCFSVSTYSKDPQRVFGLEQEIELAEAELDRVEAASPGAERVFIEGNHCDRLRRYLQDRAPELFAFVDVPKLLKLKKRGWRHVAYKDSITVGKLHITHDVGSAGRYNVFKALDTFQAPIVTGHTHRMAYVVEGDATGGSQVSAQFGWLGDVEQIDYMHKVKAKRDWTLGFGYGYVNSRTSYVYLVPVPVVNYSVVVEGRLYEAPRKKAA